MTDLQDTLGSTPADSWPATQPQTYTRKATGLVREVRLADMIAFNGSAASPVGLVLAIVVFAELAAFPGANLVLDLVIAAAVLPVIWVTYSLMSAAMPGVGGDYLYGSRILHPVVGLFSNLCTFTGAILSVGLAGFLFVGIGVAPALSAVGVVAHSQGWIDAATTVSSHGWTLALGAAVIIAISALSMAGTKIIARVMAWGYYIALGGSAVALLILLLTTRHHFVTSINDVSAPYTGQHDTYSATIAAGAKAGLAYPDKVGYSASSTLGALFLAIMSVTATLYGVFLAAEMKGGGKRRRQLAAQAGTGYLQIAFILVGVLIIFHTAGYNFVTAASNGSYGVPTGPFFTFFASAVTGSPVVTMLISLSFLAALPPWLFGNLGLCQRVPFALAFDGLLPRKVAEVNRRTHTPVVSIVINMILGLACLVYATYATSFIQVISYTAVAGLVTFIVVGISAVAMRWRRPELYDGSSAEWKLAGIHVLPIVGAGCCALGIFLYYLVFRFHAALGIVHTWSALALVGGIAVVSIVIYMSAKLAARRQGVDIDLAYRTIPVD